jgi:hypothetical protein
MGLGVRLGRMFFYCNPHWIEEICDTPAELLASRDPSGACAEEAWQTVGGKGADFLKGLCIMISTPGTRFPRAVRPRLFACGVSLGHAFPAGVSYLPFQSNGTFFLRDIEGKLALLLQFV